MALTPGTRLGAYTIGAPLGVGGMGEVAIEVLVDETAEYRAMR
jgi:hypothetical protein